MSNMSKFKRIEIAPNVFHLHFRHRRSLCSTFLRFQEHYESPKFRGKIFSLEEYKKWYLKNAPRAKKTGKFTYYGDWSGFNIPSTVLLQFISGKFGSLSSNERQMLRTFADLTSSGKLFYIIGTYGKKPAPSTLKHEIAHGLFATNTSYRAAALKIVNLLNAADKKALHKYLASSGGYHPSVYLDEMHAYLLTNCERLIEKKIVSTASRKAHVSLDKLFVSTSKKKR